MTTLHNLQAGDILSSAEVEQIRAVCNSLEWIVEFCNDHFEWFGMDSPDDGAEHEWLETANKLTKDTP